MNTLWDFMLSNAILVTLMAGVVIFVSRWISNAYIVRGLWLLVLVKLVTPPVYSYPVEIPWGNEPMQTQTKKEQLEEQQSKVISSDKIEKEGNTNSSFSRKADSGRNKRQYRSQHSKAHHLSYDRNLVDFGFDKLEFRSKNKQDEAELFASIEKEQQQHPQQQARIPSSTIASQTTSVKSEEQPHESSSGLLVMWNSLRNRLIKFPWTRTLATLWLVGSLFCFCLLTFRFFKFFMLLKRTNSAPERIQIKTKQLAQTFGLKKVPEVCVVDERISPFVWGTLGRTQIVLPRGLILQMSDNSLDTLIAHELSHLERNDHLVRWLETVVTAIYWWHPVVWFARHQLRELEEITCDATVVARFPNEAKSYAHALLDTVDFLSGAKPFLPPLACGVAPVHSLRKRITCIMKNNHRSPVTVWGKVVVIAAALSLLPFSVSSAQKKNENTEASNAVKKALEEANKAIREAEAALQKSKDKEKDRSSSRSRSSRSSRSSERIRSRSSKQNFNTDEFRKQIEAAVKQARGDHAEFDHKKLQAQIEKAMKQFNNGDFQKQIEQALKHVKGADGKFDQKKIQAQFEKAMKQFKNGEFQAHLKHARKAFGHAKKHFNSKNIHKHVQQALKHAHKAHLKALDTGKLRKQIEKAIEKAKAEGKDFDEKEVRAKIEKALKIVEKIKVEIDFSNIEKSVESAMKAAEAAMKQFEHKDLKDLEKKIEEAMKKGEVNGTEIEEVEAQIEKVLEEVEEAFESIEENIEVEVEKAIEKHESEFEKVEDAIETEVEPILEEIKADLGYESFKGDGKKGFTNTFRKDGKILEGSGKEKSETRKVGNFTSAHVGGSFLAEISQGEKHSVTVTGDDNLLDYVVTTVKDGNLVVTFSKTYKDEHPELKGIHTMNRFKVKITAPSLKSVGVSGATKASVSNMNSDTFSIHVNGAAHVTLSGECKNFAVHSGGAAQLDASDMKASVVTAQASGASHSKINASKSLSAKASGASHIRYSGNPENVMKSKTGVAKIVKATPSV